MSEKPKNVEDIYELSPVQQTILRQSPATLQWVYTIRNLRVPAFRQAWHRVMVRHPILRTSFHWEGLSKPLQVVHREVPVPLEELDWREIPAEARKERRRAFLEEDRHTPFVLTKPPLMRLVLIRVASAVYRLVWTYHPLILDSRSRALVFAEVIAFYQALRRKQQIKPKRSRPYRDYITLLQKKDPARAEAFWRRKLQGFTKPTPVALNPPPSVAPGPQATKVLRVKLSTTLVSALRSLAKQQQLPLPILIQGAWALVLSRHCGRKDLVFGYSISGPPPALAGNEPMIGLFHNIVPVRVRVSPAKKLLPWLKELQAAQVEWRQFDYFPSEQVQDWCEVPRPQPLFDSLVSMETEGMGKVQLQKGSKLKVALLRRPMQRPICPLAVAMGREGATLRIVYATSKFDEATVRGLLKQLRAVLRGIATRPEQKLSKASAPGKGKVPRLPKTGGESVDLLLGLCLGILHQQGGAESDAILVPLQPLGSRPPFFCVQPAGSTARVYQPLAHHLGQEQPCYGLQPRVRDSGQGSPPRLEDLAAQCLEAVRSVQANGPYFLGGWSTGGVVAFEMAQQLVRQGQAIGCLALLDASLPIHRQAPTFNVMKFVQQLSRQLRLGISLDLYLALPPEEQSRLVLEQAKTRGIFPSNVDDAFFRHHARLFHAHLQAVRDYVAQPYPNPVVLLRGSETVAKEKSDPKLGWEKFAAAVELHELPGTHTSMVREPHVQALADKLKGLLSRA